MHPAQPQSASRNPEGVDQWVEAWQQRRDERARDRLIRQYHRFIWKQAHRAARTWHLDPDDARQVSAMGFIRALEDYDVNAAALTTYSANWIRSAIAQTLIPSRGAVTLPTSWHSSHTTVRKAMRELQAMGVEPTPKAIAEHLPGFSEARITVSLAGAPTGSLDAPIGGESNRSWLDILAAPAEHRPDVLFDEASTALAIRTAVDEAMASALTPREREITSMRLHDEMGMLEIAEQLGVTKQNISLTMQRAIAKLRAALMGDERVMGALTT